MAKLTRREEDILKLIHSKSHLGPANVNKSMERYLSHRTETGANIINVLETYNKIKLAARVIAGIASPSQVLVCSSKETGQRAAIKFSHYTKTNCTSNSRWVPGALTNQKTGHFREPRLVIVVDPYSDRKAVVEASYANIPVIALASLDSDLQFVDICIPCNNKLTESISMVFWLLAREVLILRGEHDKSKPWDVFVDLFYYKQIDLAAAVEEKGADSPADAKAEAADADEADGDDWGQETTPEPKEGCINIFIDVADVVCPSWPSQSGRNRGTADVTH